LPVVQSSTTKQVSVANLTAGRAVDTASVSTTAGYTFYGADNTLYPLMRYVGGTNNPGVFAKVVEASSYASLFGSGSNGALELWLGGGAVEGVLKLGGANATLSTGNLVIGTSGKGVTTGSSIPLGFGVNGSTSQVTIDTSGRFLLGTTSASTGGVNMAAVLDSRTVNSGFGLGVIGNASNTQIMRFAYDTTAVGSIVISASTTTYNITSDQDLKNDLGVVTETDVIANTVIHDYTWKVDGTKARGPFAQEAHKVNPLAVTVGSDELDENGNKINPWQIDLSKYIPDIIVELQSLRKRVAELEAKG
jgi:hypothetical protein